MSDHLLLFSLSALWVFAMAFQSRAINSGQYMVAAPTSFVIGTMQVFVLSRVIGPEASILETLTYCLGGAAGSCGAMWAHKNLFPNILKG